MTGPAPTIAGIGCRKGTPPDPIIALVQLAARQSPHPIQALAAPAFKRQEPGLHQAAAALGLPLLFVEDSAMTAAQPHCLTRSHAAERATGLPSVAEAAAIAASGGTLLVPRLTGGPVTCAIAGPARP